MAGASKHNLRQYQSSDYDPEKIIVLRGENNILEDVKQIYHQEFEEALKEYNKGKRSDRQIDDYLQYVSESGKNDVAAEMIIQLGDKEFWTNKSMEQKVKMKEVFQNQIEALEKLVPAFKIASAVLHLDEASPHMHIVGVPVATGYKRGLAKQTAKTKVFTMETLSMLQEEMHKKAEEEMEQNPELFAGEEIKTIERGRNSDWSKEYFVHKRDSVMKANIPGAREGMYMSTDSLMTDVRPISVQGDYALEARGLWRIKGDFMGGPFVSHVRLDKANQRIIVSEIFIYSPDKMKRNLVRQMEASLYTLKLPGSKQEGAEIPVGVTSKDTTNNK